MNRRKQHELESILEDVFIHQYSILQRKKFNLLAGQDNFCSSGRQTWLTNWREYIDDNNETLSFINIGFVIIILWANWSTNGLSVQSGSMDS